MIYASFAADDSKKIRSGDVKSLFMREGIFVYA
jgi:hypothetical protein